MDMSGNLTDSYAVVNNAAQRFYDAVSVPLSSSEVAILFGGVALMVAAISYIVLGDSKHAILSRKAQQAKAMRQAYKSMEKQSSLSNNKESKVGSSSTCILFQDISS
jgi:hypothetical protein